MGQLLSAARAKPGMITYASAGIASATHVGMEEFLLAAGARMHHVPYKGGAPALSELLGGQVDALADSTSWIGEVRRGRLRFLATFGGERLKGFPDVSTLKELGFNVVDAPNGIAGPAGLAPHNVSRLHLAQSRLERGIQKACDRLHVPVLYQDAERYSSFVMSQHAYQKGVIEQLKLREQLRSG